MHTMVDQKVESEAQIIMLVGTKPIGLAKWKRFKLLAAIIIHMI